MHHLHKKSALLSLALVAPLMVACAGNMPPPTERLADAQGAERSAREVGANNVPAAQLSLKLSQEQIAQAEKAMAEDDNERADSLLRRAQVDADLANAQAREKGAKSGHEEAISDSAAQDATNVGQGAVN